MPEKALITIEFRFVSEEDPAGIGDRIREAAAMIVGREAVEDFKIRSIPLVPKKEPGGVS